MPELSTYGSARGVPGNGHPYRKPNAEFDQKLTFKAICQIRPL